MTVFVHGHVDAVTVSGPANPPVCVSQNQTEQFTAKAFSNGQDITSKVGPFTWSTGSTIVASVDQKTVARLSPHRTTVARQMLRLVLPKGSLERQTLELFDAADLSVNRSSNVAYHATIDEPTS